MDALCMDNIVQRPRTKEPVRPRRGVRVGPAAHTLVAGKSGDQHPRDQFLTVAWRVPALRMCGVMSLTALAMEVVSRPNYEDVREAYAQAVEPTDPSRAELI